MTRIARAGAARGPARAPRHTTDALKILHRTERTRVFRPSLRSYFVHPLPPTFRLNLDAAPRTSSNSPSYTRVLTISLTSSMDRSILEMPDTLMAAAISFKGGVCCTAEWRQQQQQQKQQQQQHGQAEATQARTHGQTLSGTTERNKSEVTNRPNQRPRRTGSADRNARVGYVNR